MILQKLEIVFFEGFNALEWALISLPANSFNISSITSVNNYFFNRFNGSDWGLNTWPGWHLISLPDGSFNVNSTITVGWYNFFAGFNKNWDLEKDSSWIKIFVPNSSNIPASPYWVTFDYSDGSSERVLRNNYSTWYRKD